MQLEYWTEAMEKQTGARLQVMLDDPDLARAWMKFGGAPFRRSSIFHGLQKILRENDVRGRCCFEIGTWNGLTAAVLSRFFDEVVTVDIAHNEQKREILNFLRVKNVRCVDIKDNAEKADIARDLDFDFAYLDGDHANDTEADFAMTKKGGRVLFHEVWPHQEPVWNLVNRLPPETVTYGGACLALWDQSKGKP
jgi:hypothetical protein